MSWKILQGDVLDRLRELPDESVQCCVTSPPYWGLRDYGAEGQIGMEATPEEHVAKLVEVFREVRRVLRSDGALWLNYGDAYAAAPNGGQGRNGQLADRSAAASGIREGRGAGVPRGLKPKDLVGLPWMLAFALRADGWWLRSDCIWHKPNPMPESIRDRPTKAHEYVFLLSKSARYFYDAEAILEETTGNTHARRRDGTPSPKEVEAEWTGAHAQAGKGMSGNRPISHRNARTVWTINPQPMPEAHFATFPEALAERCIRSGSRRGDTVLDPFAGSGTTLAVAERLGRDSIGIELNPAYIEMAVRRISKVDPTQPIKLADGRVQGSLFG